MSDADAWAAARAALTDGGLHEEVTVGERVYQVDLRATDDDRVDVDFVSCDADGDLISHLSGVIPAEDVAVAGTLLAQLLTRAAQRLGIRPTTGGYTLPEVRRHHPNAYERWTDDLDAALIARRRAGASVEELMVEFGRNHGAIVARLEKLGTPVDTPVVTIYDELGRPPGVAPPSGLGLATHPTTPTTPATVPPQSRRSAPWQPPQPTDPHYIINIGSVERFDHMVELLIDAGAHSSGRRRQFIVTPPLTESQLSALRYLKRSIDGVEVTVVPDGTDLTQADPSASEPDAEFRPKDWWDWQVRYHGDPDHRPERFPRGRRQCYDDGDDIEEFYESYEPVE